MQEELDFNLIIFSPYRDLTIFLKDAKIPEVDDCAWCEMKAITHIPP